MALPAILYIPGSFSPLHLFQPLFDGVSKEGLDIKGIHLPTIGLSSREGRPGPAPSMYDDAAVITKEISMLAEQGKDVILCGHSYGGVPMSQATKGLSKEERAAQGNPGGVIHLAYQACLVPPIGSSAGALLSQLPDDKRPPVSIDEDGWMLIEDPAATAALTNNKLSPGQGEAIVRSFAKHSAQSFGNELTHAGYLDIPLSYLFCEEDLAGPPPFQRDMIAMIEKASGNKVDVTSINADHCAHLSVERKVVEWIVNVAKKAQATQQRR